jgi:hypothetical protein
MQQQQQCAGAAARSQDLPVPLLLLLLLIQMSGMRLVLLQVTCHITSQTTQQSAAAAAVTALEHCHYAFLQPALLLCPVLLHMQLLEHCRCQTLE